MRFKFMPTPSAPLHLGHAWITLLSQAWIRALRARGEPAEFVLVFDVLTNVFYRRSSEASERFIVEITDDVHLLDINPDAVALNDAPLPADVEAELEQLTQQDIARIFPGWRPQLEMPPSHFLRIAAWDRELGVTHIVRGRDRLPYDAVYRDCYAALGYPAPRMEYVPLLLTSAGKRISAGHAPYRVSEVMRRFAPEELQILLVQQCLGRESTLSLESAFENAEATMDFFDGLVEEPRILLGEPQAAAVRQAS